MGSVSGIEQNMLARLIDLVRQVSKDELLSRFNRVVREEKADGSFVTEADFAAQQRMQAGLKQLAPDVLFLGEEMTDEQQTALMSQGKALWVLDPLDGTSNYSSGVPYFAMSLALVENNQVRLGIVYDPIRDECFYASNGGGAFCNDVVINRNPLHIPLSKSIALIDFKRLPMELRMKLISDLPYASQRSFGSVALDWCWLAMGRCHVYLHGRSNIWDYVAGNLVFAESGGYSCTLEGEAVFVNRLDGRSSVAATELHLFKEWQRTLGIEAV